MTVSSGAERILVLTPARAEAQRLQSCLAQAGMTAEVCTDVACLCEAIERGAGIALVSWDAMTETAVSQLAKVVGAQSAWSDFPLVVLTDPQASEAEATKLIELIGDEVRVMLLERPTHGITLTSVVRTALQARRRQYQLRDHLEQVARQRKALQESEASLERRVAERTKALREQTVKLRRLASQLFDAEQRERSRLATTLHDGLQQLLVAAQMRLQSCRRTLPEPVHPALAKVRELLDESISTSRALVVELSPPVLQNAQFPEVLEWLVDWFRQQHELEVTLVHDGKVPPLPDRIKVVLFQIARELLFNVTRHSGTLEARMELSVPGDRVRMVVQDKGRGFDPAQIDSMEASTAFGLFNVRERLEAIGGKFRVTSSPGRGTRVEVLSPPVAVCEMDVT